MQKMILVIATLLLLTSASINSYAQSTEKKGGEKPLATTVDAWRGALPQNEQTSDTPPAVVMEESKDNVETRETTAEIEKRVLDLELRLTAALKQSDTVALTYLLADDFMPVGINITESQSGKGRYIQWALKNSELKSYTLEKTTVRAYRTTAIVTTQYKLQTSAAGASSDVGLIATDVWVKRGKLWQNVSRHVSPLASNQLPKQ